MLIFCIGIHKIWCIKYIKYIKIKNIFLFTY